MTIAKTFPVPRLPLVQVFLPADYPEGPSAEAIEAQVQQSLPPLAGLADARSLDERVAVYGRELSQQRAAFMGIHGHDALGCEAEENRATVLAFLAHSSKPTPIDSRKTVWDLEAVSYSGS